MFIFSPLPFSLPSFLPFPSMEEGAMEKKKVNHNFGSSLTSLKVINILFFFQICAQYIQNIYKTFQNQNGSILLSVSLVSQKIFCVSLKCLGFKPNPKITRLPLVLIMFPRHIIYMTAQVTNGKTSMNLHQISEDFLNKEQFV